jgi:hypothetical protein
MDRRELFGVLGATGASLLVEGQAARADGHGDRPDTGGAPTPLSGFHAHFCGIHIAKKDPKFQLVTQHYCGPLGDEMHQCLLFDSCKKSARLLGVEYFISDRLYRTLSDEEKKYWHPHTYEVLAGGLVAPGMSAADELKFMKALLTTWGKSVHTWPDPTTTVPVGEPLLMWSAMGDGQIDPKIAAARDKELGTVTEKLREVRCREIGLEVPQVSPPRSIDQVGRQWTDDGDDKPTRRK